MYTTFQKNRFRTEYGNFRTEYGNFRTEYGRFYRTSCGKLLKSLFEMLVYAKI